MKLIRNSTLCAGLLALAGTAQAGVIYSSSPTITAWSGTPVYTSIPNAGLNTFTGQSDPAITGSFGLMAETFTPGSSFTLGAFNIMTSGNAAGTFQIHLYDLGPAGTVAVTGNSTYTPGTDLFTGLSVTLVAGTPGQGAFTLSGADQVSLLGNEEYALEIWTPSALGASGLLWSRNSVVDPGGQMYSGGDNTAARATLAANGQAGGTPRTATLALYSAPVPEPASMTLLGLGTLIGVGVIRRRR